MSWIGDVGNWISRNTSWLAPVVSGGLGIANNVNQSNTQSRYLDILRQQEQQRYDDYSRDYDAYADYVSRASAASNAAAAARASAAAATEANRQRALKKSMKRMNRGYAEALGMAQPYVAVGNELLPKMRDLYAAGLGNAQATMGQVFTPQNMANLAAPQQAWNTNIPLPDYLKRR